MKLLIHKPKKVLNRNVLTEMFLYGFQSCNKLHTYGGFPISIQSLITKELVDKEVEKFILEYPIDKEKYKNKCFRSYGAELDKVLELLEKE